MRAKYAGREWVMERQVLPLGKLWNDVIHLAPVHPFQIMLSIQALGVPVADRRWFQIPVERIAHLPAMYLVPPPEPRPFRLDDFKPFSPGDYRELEAMPPEALESNRTLVPQGLRPLIMNRTLHVLVDGDINVSGLPVLSWLDRA